MGLSQRALPERGGFRKMEIEEGIEGEKALDRWGPWGVVVVVEGLGMREVA